MISDKMQAALNKQIELEGYASFYYLSMASWCDNEGLEGCAKFFHRQSAEENMHMLKIFHYLSEVGGVSRAPGIAQPPADFESIQTVFKLVYEHEQKVTRSINDLVRLAYEEKDYTTQNFLEWYISEQREEEALIRMILDKIKLIGTGGMSLYYIDKEIEIINTTQIAAEAADGN